MVTASYEYEGQSLAKVNATISKDQEGIIHMPAKSVLVLRVNGSNL